MKFSPTLLVKRAMSLVIIVSHIWNVSHDSNYTKQHWHVHQLSLITCRAAKRGQGQDGASPTKVWCTRNRTDCHKVYLAFFISVLLKNQYQPEESGVDMSTLVHPTAQSLGQGKICPSTLWSRGAHKVMKFDK